MSGSRGPNRPPVSEASSSFHYGNESLERAEFDAGVGRYNKKLKPASLLGRLKALLRRPAR
jgi:hypothetical protein